MKLSDELRELALRAQLPPSVTSAAELLDDCERVIASIVRMSKLGGYSLPNTQSLLKRLREDVDG